jgi:hypothetical protein
MYNLFRRVLPPAMTHCFFLYYLPRVENVFFCNFFHTVKKLKNCNWIITFVEGCAVDYPCISNIKKEEEEKTFLFLSFIPICRRCWRQYRLAWRCRLVRRSRFPAIGRRRFASSSPGLSRKFRFVARWMKTVKLCEELYLMFTRVRLVKDWRWYYSIFGA